MNASYRNWWNSLSPEERAQRSREKKLRARGISAEEYDRRLAEQEGRCAICGTDDPRTRGGMMPLDHDHTSGTPRKLLCMLCNSGLGMFQDRADLLRRAADYVDFFSARGDGDGLTTGANQ